jgi:hypothetical protein
VKVCFTSIYKWFVCRLRITNLLSLHKVLKVALGGDKDAPTEHFVQCKNFKQQSLHIYVEMLDYYLKNSCEYHFQFVKCNVSAKEKIASKLKHAKYGVCSFEESCSFVANQCYKACIYT